MKINLALNVVLIQCCLIFLGTIILRLGIDRASSLAFFYGGGAVILPNLFFIKYIKYHCFSGNAQNALAFFYLGEFFKLLLSLILLLLLFKLVSSRLIFLFLGYIAGNLAILFLPFLTCIKS